MSVELLIIEVRHAETTFSLILATVPPATDQQVGQEGVEERALVLGRESACAERIEVLRRVLGEVVEETDHKLERFSVTWHGGAKDWCKGVMCM